MLFLNKYVLKQSIYMVEFKCRTIIMPMDNYTFGRTIAQGTNSVIKEAYDVNGAKYAIKIIPLTAKSFKYVKKEATIHRYLRHKNIVFFKELVVTSNYFLIMEHVFSELFLYIEPRIGLHHKLVHFFMKQLILAVSYMHSKGICHRDLKPENLLLSLSGNLMVTDFGSATMFKYRGKIRQLKVKTGTVPYIAPEIYTHSYDGKSSDIWSCGIILFVMSLGVLPWQNGDVDDREFITYTKLRYHNYDPFSRLPKNIYDLFKGMCNINVSKRFKMNDIKKSTFFLQSNDLLDSDNQCANASMLFSYFKTKNMVVSPFTQPYQWLISITPAKSIISQPENNESIRTHRIYLTIGGEKTLQRLNAVLRHLNVQFKQKMFTIFFTTFDGRRNILAGEFTVRQTNGTCVISTNRLRGCLLEFKDFCGVVFDFLKSKKLS